MKKSDLSAPRTRLVEFGQWINYGRIEHLPVRGREPVLEPRPRVIRTVKLVGQNGPRPELVIHDFELKREWTELFEHFDLIGDGEIHVIEIVRGLPFLFELQGGFDG